MKTISAAVKEYKGEKRIMLYAEYSPEINKAIGAVKGRLYSRTLKCWHLPGDIKLLAELKSQLPSGWKMAGLEPSQILLWRR